MRYRYLARRMLRRAMTWSIAAGTLAVVAAPASAAPACATPLSPLQQRLLARFEQGPDVLRDYVFSRRGIYLLDIADVLHWAARVEDGHCDTAM